MTYHMANQQFRTGNLFFHRLSGKNGGLVQMPRRARRVCANNGIEFTNRFSNIDLSTCFELTAVRLRSPTSGSALICLATMAMWNVAIAKTRSVSTTHTVSFLLLILLSNLLLTKSALTAYLCAPFLSLSQRKACCFPFLSPCSKCLTNLQPVFS